MARRRARAHSAVGEGLYLVELSRRRLDGRRPRSPARPHLGVACAQGYGERFPDFARRARLDAAVGPRAGYGDAGGVAPHPEEPRSGVSKDEAKIGASWFETRA